MTMKNDTKIEEELTCHFKIDLSNLTNFDPSIQVSKIFTLNELLLTNIYNISAKEVQRSYLS